MATEWKSQQCFDEGKYYLQFETDDRDKFKFMEKSAQSAIDGKLDIKTEVRHGEWIYNRGQAPREPTYFCSLCAEGGSEYGKDNYCSHCGAKMGGE